MLTQRLALTLVLGVLPQILPAQEPAEYHVYTDSPRLLLRERRLRLLKRERERQSLRWNQFSSLMEGRAAMPDPGFASALYGAVADSAEHCRAAAQSAGADPRQAALVLDWCRERLSAAQRDALSARLRAQLSARPANVFAARNRVFAALVLADDEPAAAERALRDVVESWWKASAAPQVRQGKDLFSSPEQVYALLELAHVLRDNLTLELREDAPDYFDELPALQMLSTYPSPWPAPENLYRIPMFEGAGDPDLRQAGFSRAASLALVALDTNAQPQQFLQGWLLLDTYLMRGTHGIPYEFLWANPYQPGLSYYYMPDVYHAHGRLLLRSSWDDDASWFAYRDGKAQYFKEGQRASVNLQLPHRPIQIGDATILLGAAALRFVTGEMPVDEEGKKFEQDVFLLGLPPNTRYDVEPDDEEMFEAATDEGGIMALKFPRGRKVEVRLKPATAPPPPVSAARQ